MLGPHRMFHFEGKFSYAVHPILVASGFCNPDATPWGIKGSGKPFPEPTHVSPLKLLGKSETSRPHHSITPITPLLQQSSPHQDFVGGAPGEVVYVAVFSRYRVMCTVVCDYIHYIVCFVGFPLGDKL